MGRKAGSKNKSTLAAESQTKIETPWVEQPKPTPVANVDPDDAQRAKIIKKCKEKAFDEYWILFSDKSRESIDGYVNLFLKNLDEHYSLRKRKQ